MKISSKTALTPLIATIAGVAGIAGIAVLLSAGLAVAQPPAKSATPVVQKAQAPVGFRAEFLVLLDDVQKKILTLADAVPADKYSWRPAPGVRSVGEVYMHLAATNFYLPTLWGAKPPADSA